MARLLKDYTSISLKPENLQDKIDFKYIFGRSAPVHIEVGSGKGTFLLNQAQAEPQINFLGIEWANKYYRHAVDRIGRWEIKNVRIIRADAAKFLPEFVPDDSVDCFHIYFPDPWPKKRHHKRRLISHQNLEQLLRCLKQEGIIKIATDHAEYFQQIEAVLAAKENCLEEINFLPTSGADTGEWVGTNFERKYIKENRPVYTVAVKKISPIPLPSSDS
ncbi:MAG: tRNA (guanosine(46)-N7)-methyltransferase TrmB [Planctomycetes bacterium]|nr:tRNA (guanosine(46)-N7)-methyltransferase TrmB [Planctomycetota bacterium]